MASVLLVSRSESPPPVSDLEGSGVLVSDGSWASDGQIVLLDDANLYNADGLFCDLLSRTHFSVKLGKSSFEGDGSEFLESINLSSSVSISEVDSVVSSSGGVSLSDSLDLDDFTLTVLELMETLVKLPRVKIDYQN